MEPLLDLLVALASDIPQCFYEHFLFPVIPHLIAHTFIKVASQIESIFNCLVSLLVVLEKYSRKDVFKLYTCCFSELLSGKRPWYINDLAAQSFAFVVRKISHKELFFYKVFKRLLKDGSQIRGVGKLLTAVMKSNTLNRLHLVSQEVLSSVLKLVLLKDLPTKSVLEVLQVGLKGLAYFVTSKNPSAKWQNFWKEDCALIWDPVWKQFHSIADGEMVIDLPFVKKCRVSEKTETSKATGDNNDLLIDQQEQLHCILSVVELLAEFKRGELLPDINIAFDNLEKIVQCDVSISVSQSVTEIAAILLKSEHHQPKGTQGQIRRNAFIDSIFQSKCQKTVLFSFMRETIDLPNFEQELLPKVLTFLNLSVNSCKEELKEALVVLLDIIMHHQPPLKSAQDLDNWQCYPIYFIDSSEEPIASEGDEVENFPQLITSFLSEGLSSDLSNCEELLSCLLCLPHVKNIDYQDAAGYIAPILDEALTKLRVAPKPIMANGLPDIKKDETVPFSLSVDLDTTEETQKLLFIINVCVEAMAHTLSREDFLSLLSGMDLVTILKQSPQHRENSHLLRAIDLYFTIFANSDVSDDQIIENPLTDSSFSELYAILAPSLSSPHPLTRLLVTHILSLFPLNLPPPPEGAEEPDNLFQIMYKIESCPLTALNYKERLRLMSLLDAEHISPHLPLSGECSEAPLLFAIGQFYVNFTPIWNSVKSFIAGYAETLPSEQFWSLWMSKLKLVSHCAFSTITEKDASIQKVFPPDSVLNSVHEYLSSHEGYKQLSTKINHLDARDCMWRAMLLFPSVCEANAHNIVASFIEFLKVEMQTVDFSVAPTQNLQEELLDTILEEEEETEEDKRAAEEKSKRGKFTFSSLCNYLQLFGKFNIKKLADAKKLEDIFLDLIVHPSAVVRGYALSCMFAFKYKYITPYEETIMRIHNDRTFKSGINSFAIDASEEGNASISSKHRRKFMQFYIRFIYGKMQGKVAKNALGNQKPGERKAMVIRLLGGISEDESDVLLNLAFEILLPYLEDSTIDVVRKSMQGVDVTKCIPLKKLSGMLGTLDNIVSYLGNLLPSKKPFFLKVILFILSYVTALKDDTNGVAPKYMNLLKVIKNQAVVQLLKFYDCFEDYPWTSDEVEAIFLTLVWPSLSKLPSDGINHVHPLLKLFRKWSDNERLHSLFIKHHPEDKTLSCLPYLFDLASQPKIRIGVINYILSIVINLMGTEPSLASQPDRAKPKKTNNEKKENGDATVISKRIEEESSLDLLQCGDLLPVEEPICRIKGASPTFGVKILLPFISQLTKCMLPVVRIIAKGKNSAEDHLRILCEITRYVVDSDEGDELLKIIIPMLVKRKISDPDVVVHLLETTSHLLPISKDRDFFCNRLLPLFHILPGQEVRTALCKVFRQLSEVNVSYKKITSFMFGFNSWEKTVTESIDIDKRLETYKEASAYLQQLEHFDRTLILFLINQCSHDINNVDDPTLSEGCLRCFQVLIATVCRFSSSDSILFKQTMDIILTQIKKSFKSSTDEVHCLYLKVLKITLLEAGTTLKALKDLKKVLTYDEKFDFFGLMTDIQTTRRAQALSKLVNAIKEESLVLKTETLEVYIWPLVSRYLTDIHYADQRNLLLASVDCVGVIAKKLPWTVYCQMLKFFLGKLLGKMHNPKIGLRVVSIILDAFHEDVSHLVVVNKETAPTAAKVHDSDDPFAEDKEPEDNKIEISKSPAATKNEAHARKVYTVLVREIIPSLKKVFESRSKDSTKHKSNKDASSSDDDEIKKIPLALPLIKLLKKFPPKVLEANLSNVFYHLISFLKSRKRSVRKQTMEMIITVLEEVGSKYLSQMVQDLMINLNIGFRKHVLLYTIRKILTTCEKFIKVKDLAPCVENIMELCMNELFSEKEEKATPDNDEEEKHEPVEEAEGIKSYAIMIVLGRLIRVADIQLVLVPFKELIATTHRKSYVELTKKCLENFMEGLRSNTTINVRDKSIFIYGILTDRISQLKQESKVEMATKSVWDTPDRLLLEPEPKKVKLSAKTAHNTNNYVFANFAFGLLNRLLKGNVFLPENSEHCSLLDPFMGLITEFFHSSNPEVTVECLRCFSQMIKFPLPSLKIKIDGLTAQMFVLLNKYSSTELEKGKMYELVHLTFHTLAVLIRSVPFCNLQDEHLRVLLMYIKDNLNDNSHQHTVFSLLQAILAKRIDAPEILPIMDIVKEIIVKDTSVSVLDQARSMYFSYIMNYSLLKQSVIKIFSYFVDNLDYSLVQGRISVCLMLDNLIGNLPPKTFSNNLVKKLWLQLLVCLIKEDDARCRKHQQDSLRRLFQHTERQKFLVQESLKLMKDNPENSRSVNATHVRLGCLSFLAFMNNPFDCYPRNFLTEVLPCVVSLLHPSRFEEIIDCDDVNEQLCIDKSLLELMRLFGKLFTSYKSDAGWKKYADDKVWEHIAENLSYNEMQVRIFAGSLLGLLFEFYPVEKSVIPGIVNSTEKAYSLAVTLTEQFTCTFPVNDDKYQELYDMTIRNLIYLIRQSTKIPIITKKVLTDEPTLSLSQLRKLDSYVQSVDKFGQMAACTAWILENVAKTAYEDIQKKRTVKRTALLHLIVAVVVLFKDNLVSSGPTVEFIMSYLVREDKSAGDEKFLTLYSEVKDCIKETLGWDDFSKLMRDAQDTLTKRKVARRINKKERLHKS